jgi:hypothetical protein
MTCEEVMRLYRNVKPEDCTVATVAALAGHVRRCPSCAAQFTRDDAIEGTPAITAEQEALVQNLIADPEALAVLRGK